MKDTTTHMSALHFRPEIRAPWQAIVAFVVALYVVRSAMRGWDFRPAVLDIVVFGALGLILVARPLIDHLLRPDDETDQTNENGNGPAA